MSDTIYELTNQLKLKNLIIEMHVTFPLHATPASLSVETNIIQFESDPNENELDKVSSFDAYEGLFEEESLTKKMRI